MVAVMAELAASAAAAAAAAGVRSASGAAGGYFGGSGGGKVIQTGGGGGGAGMGGAVFNEAGTVVITNSTFTANTANGGAGGMGQYINNGEVGQGAGRRTLQPQRHHPVTNSTFSANTAAKGGRDIFNFGDSNYKTTASTTASATINNTILGQADTAVQDFTGKTVGTGTNVTSGTGNLIRTQSGFAGTVVSTADPLLGPLQNNGGPTSTMALLPASPAFEAGANITPLATPTASAYFYANQPGDLLRPGTYSYRVSAFNSAGETLASTEVSAVVPYGLTAYYGSVLINLDSRIRTSVRLQSLRPDCRE